MFGVRCLAFDVGCRLLVAGGPKKTTFTRVLHEVDDDLIEAVLLRWQDQIPVPRQDRMVIVEGKKVRHGGVEVVNAADSKGRFLGSVVTESKSNEILAARQLLGGQDLPGKITVADAMHTQDETGRQILFEGGGDYLLTVKGKWSREVVYLVSSFAQEELQAEGMLSIKRGYWVVESRLHHCLNITLREDQSRVRTPKAARILGTIRRVVVSLANAAVNRARRKNPKTKCNTASFQKRFRSARGGRQ